MSNNNSIEAATSTNINSMNNNYTVEIADRTGHTTLADLSLEEATTNILEHAENNARWVFINGEKFEFEGGNYRAEANVQKLKAKLQATADPAVLLTGVLVGGAIWPAAVQALPEPVGEMISLFALRNFAK